MTTDIDDLFERMKHAANTGQPGLFFLYGRKAQQILATRERKRGLEKALAPLIKPFRELVTALGASVQKIDFMMSSWGKHR